MREVGLFAFSLCGSCLIVGLMMGLFGIVLTGKYCLAFARLFLCDWSPGPAHERRAASSKKQAIKVLRPEAFISPVSLLYTIICVRLFPQ